MVPVSPDSLNRETAVVVRATRDWLEKAVIGLNLCPFAKPVFVRKQIRYMVSVADSAEALIVDLGNELQSLAAVDPELVETTLIIHPRVLTDFLHYNDFLAVADRVVAELGLTGVIQVASFHPDYRFAGTARDDVTNHTNRSPYPMLNLLREASVSAAVATFAEADRISERNMETMRRLGVDGLTTLNLIPPARR